MADRDWLGGEPIQALGEECEVIDSEQKFWGDDSDHSGIPLLIGWLPRRFSVQAKAAWKGKGVYHSIGINVTSVTSTRPHTILAIGGGKMDIAGKVYDWQPASQNVSSGTDSLRQALLFTAYSKTDLDAKNPDPDKSWRVTSHYYRSGLCLDILISRRDKAWDENKRLLVALAFVKGER